MFSHIVVFWTKPEINDASAQLIAGVEKYLRPIPGVLTLHVGQVVSSPRPVVEQSYQVALNVIFTGQTAHDAYQVHPLHLEFVAKISPVWAKVLVYDFA